MTSKLTSHTLCAHNSKEGDLEFGGVGVKGCCGKVRWNTVRQGEVWINGVFCEDEFLTSNHNPSAIGFQTAPDSCKDEHSEVDWISKEIAFQEFICSDRPSHWPDLNSGKNDFGKEEHDIDIISTLTAVAALFRDWCAVETDLSEPLVEERFDQKEWAWINDANAEASKAVDVLTSLPTQNDVLKWNNCDLAWDGFVNERLKNQQVLCHAFFHHSFMGKEVASESTWLPHITAFQEDTKACQEFISTKVCSKSRSEEESQFHRHPLQYCGGVAESQDTCIHDQFGRISLLAADGDQNNCMEPFVDMGLQNSYVMFGSQSPTASRYSFGREGGTGFTSEMGEMLPSVISEEELMDDFSFEERLFLMDETFNGTGHSNSDENGNNEVVMIHEAMLYALSYMSLQDLLTMEKVSRSLRDWVRNDVLLWQQLHIEPPLSKSFTDEVLLELVSRSKGQLQCLNLVDCTRVTEAAVEQVVSSNPRLAKLCLPGCSRISADAVVRMVEILTNFRPPGMPGFKQLRVRNIYGLTREHLESLQNMVGARAQDQSSLRKPQYYHNGHYASSCDDERPIDVEECPKCTNVRLVYDCTRERCQQRQGIKLQECRACILCIVRCEECGRCINDNDYEETFSLDLLCSCCWLRLPKCAECNRPGCGRHADHFIRTPETTFVCSDCCGPSPGTSGPEFHVYA